MSTASAATDDGRCAVADPLEKLAREVAGELFAVRCFTGSHDMCGGPAIACSECGDGIGAVADGILAALPQAVAAVRAETWEAAAKIAEAEAYNSNPGSPSLTVGTRIARDIRRAAE